MEGEDRQIQSIGDQTGRLIKLARDVNRPIKEVFTEAKSAKKPNIRPIFGEMLRRIEAGEADGILCWQINRLFRNPLDQGRIHWLLQQGIIKSILTIDREYLPEDNALLLAVEGGVANQFIVDLKKNTKRGMESKLQKGWLPTRAPEGYLNSKTAAKGEQFICKDPVRFPILRKMWDLLLTGTVSPLHILGLMNGPWGYRTRRFAKSGDKPLSRSGLYRILSNPFYTGIISYKGIEYQGKHEPIITLAEFDRVQFLLGRDGKPRTHQKTFTYAGMFRCGECGSMITAELKRKLIKFTGQIKEYTYYHCTKRTRSGVVCSQRRVVTEEALEQQILEMLKRLTILPKFLEWALEVLAENSKAETEQAERIAEAQGKSLLSLTNERNELVRMRCKNLISEELFIEEKNMLERRIWELQENIQEPKTDEKKDLCVRIFQLAARACECFVNGDTNKRREILKSVMQEDLSNQTLRDKKLSIHAAKWLQWIENDYFSLEAEFRAIEPAKTRMDTGENEVLSSIRLRWGV